MFELEFKFKSEFAFPFFLKLEIAFEVAFEFEFELVSSTYLSALLLLGVKEAQVQLPQHAKKQSLNSTFEQFSGAPK